MQWLFRFCCIAAVYLLPVAVAGSKFLAEDKQLAERRKLAVEAARKIQNLGGDGLEFDAVSMIVQDIFDLSSDGSLLVCDPIMIMRSEGITPQCDDIFGLLDALVLAFQGIICNGMGGFDEAIAGLTVLLSCVLDVPDNECPQSPFPVEKFPDGFQADNVGKENKYAWGADYNEECQAGVVVHSGGTTKLLGVALGVPVEPGFPTLTLRDANGDIIFQGYSTEKELGLRSALVIDCDGNGVYTVLSPNVSLNGASLGLGVGDILDLETTEGSLFYRFTLDTNAYNGAILEISPDPDPVPAGAPSVRKMVQQDQDTVIYAPLYDVTDSTTRPPYPILRKYDSANNRVLDVEIEIADGDDGRFDLSYVWDFECDDLLCWAGITNITDTVDRPAKFEIDPLVVYFDADELRSIDEAGGPTQKVTASVAKTDFDKDFSLNQVLPMGNGQVLACTLSGFLFQAIGAAVLAVSETETIGLIRPDDILGSFELGTAPECQMCSGIDKKISKSLKSSKSTKSMKSSKNTKSAKSEKSSVSSETSSSTSKSEKSGNTSKSEKSSNRFLEPERKTCAAERNRGQCDPVELPGQSKANAYIWQIQECGDYTFAGSLDLSNVIAEGLLNLVIGAVAAVTDIETSTMVAVLVSQNPEILEWLKALIASVLFEDTIHPCDFGFDLWYVPTEELLCSEQPRFQPITFNGFRGLDSEGDARTDLPSLFEQLYGFPAVANIDSGVRNMVCHNDEKLVIGSAVYQQRSSNTYVLDVTGISQVIV